MLSCLCGCYYYLESTTPFPRHNKHYLPLVNSESHTTILSTTSRTTLKQNFTNPTEQAIKECIYTFPLYDGVSVVSFTCHVGKRILRGLVKEKNQAKKVYNEAVAKGETAGLLEQLPEASDVFSTKLGNVPAGETIIVEISYIGELKHDAETDGIRFTIPTKIVPRYGSVATPLSGRPAQDSGGIKITVDALMAEGSFIRGVQSPSHPIAVTMGTTSTDSAADPTMSRASATLTLGSASLDKDFILVVLAKDTATPKAILETHPTIPNHRALMATLVPKFSLPPSRPEIVFVVDRSCSMQGKFPILASAMEVFLKSMPIGVKFNICSFGSSYDFLWKKSKSYSQDSLAQAMKLVRCIAANMGGTETFSAIKATIDNRYGDIPLEVMLLTDGDIWQQEELFAYLNAEVAKNKGRIRVFPLGIGSGVSSALIEGVARAGNGFAQIVQEGEKLDNRVVRMLKGALSPHISDYTLEVQYGPDDDSEDDFELVDKVTDGFKVLLSEPDQAQENEKLNVKDKAPISLFDSNANPDAEQKPANDKTGESRYAHLPVLPPPALLQAPHRIPALYPFTRTTVYLLLSPSTIQRNPTALVLHATSPHGPLTLSIPIETLPTPNQTIHQLAARKAVQDLEEGRGWLYDVRDEKKTLLKERFSSKFEDMREREAVRLGVQFQVAGRWCSFVAVAANDKETADKAAAEPAWDDDIDTLNGAADLIDYSDEEMGSSLFDARAPMPMVAAKPAAFLGMMKPEPGRKTAFGNSSSVRPASFARQAAPEWEVMNFASMSEEYASPQRHRARSSGGAGFGAAQSMNASLPPMPQTMHASTPSSMSPQTSSAGSGGGLFGADSRGQMPTRAEPGFAAPFGAPAPALAGSSSGALFGGGSVSPMPLSVKPMNRSTGSNGGMLFGAPHQEPMVQCAVPGVATPFGAPVPNQASGIGARMKRVFNPRGRSQGPVDGEEGGGNGSGVLEVYWSTRSDAEKVHRLIALQNFEGFWVFEDSMMGLMGLEKGVFRKGGIEERVWVTVLVMEFLKGKMRAEEGVWELVVEKAGMWLEGEGVQVEVLEGQAAKVLGLRGKDVEMTG